ncbi:MAG: PDDEXK nuclease domain-containing protein [Bacteroidia bacterium]|nr:PDDEXK nuclease domain-containing protein [Bacteroidia bacterium]
MSKALSNEKVYVDLLLKIKQQVRSAQAKAALAVNTSLIQLYWNLGKMIADNQELFEGRNSYVSQLAKDLKDEFSDIQGFSKRNIFYCRKFYSFYSGISVQQLVALRVEEQEKPSVQQAAALNQEALVQQPAGLSCMLLSLPWGHHMVLLDKIKEVDEALFYVQQTIEYNWSRAILTLQIEQNLYQRQGKAITNFTTTLPEKQALMAVQMLKDPYNFGFLTLEHKVQELEIEKQLTNHITKFLLELGKGFAFIGRQYPLEIGDKEYRLDLLFYHIRLRCFVVIDLKAVEFEPEFAGKMNFYLSATDDLLKTAADQPSIGIILCKSKNKVEVEYSLRDMKKPIGVSEFTVTQALPAELKSTLPTVEEFERELNKDLK